MASRERSVPSNRNSPTVTSCKSDLCFPRLFFQHRLLHRMSWQRVGLSVFIRFGGVGASCCEIDVHKIIFLQNVTLLCLWLWQISITLFSYISLAWILALLYKYLDPTVHNGTELLDPPVRCQISALPFDQMLSKTNDMEKGQRVSED